MAEGAEIKALDSLLTEADTYFRYDRFEPSIEIYEKLYQEGYFQEEMLYRLAFMHEQAKNYPASIYYLRKLQWEIGGENLEEKIQQLMINASKERLSPGESWSFYRLFVQHHYTKLSILLMALASLALIFVFLPRIWTLRLAVVFAVLGLGLGIILLDQRWAYAPKAVVISSSRYYELPSFASSHHSFPIGPGATVEILDIQDIWAKVRMEQFEAWVPSFVIRQI
ncbi:MAG: hypothetical protein AAF696_37620 [Bacteroidota bacterium]